MRKNSLSRRGGKLYHPKGGTTPASSTSNQVLYIKEKEKGTSFTVAMDQPATADVTFNFWIIN